MAIQIEQLGTVPVPEGDVITPPMDAARTVQCVRDMAGMLVLAHMGTEWAGEDGDVVGDLCDRVAAIREEFDLTPDDMQGLLEYHEPTLAPGKGSWTNLLKYRREEQVAQDSVSPDAQILEGGAVAYEADEKFPRITRRIGRMTVRAVSGLVSRFHPSGTRKP